MKPGKPPLQSIRLLEQVREQIRYLHYSLNTEKRYVYWIKFLIRWYKMKHPREMAAPQLEAFLVMLATQRKVAAAVHKQALSALLFLYHDVLVVELPWLGNVNRSTTPKRIPSVLTNFGICRLEWTNELDCPFALWHWHAHDGRLAITDERRGFCPPHHHRAASQRQQRPCRHVTVGALIEGWLVM